MPPTNLSPKTESSAGLVLKVALPLPLRRHFDYEAPPGIPGGTRVEVPFGKRKLVGIAIRYEQTTIARNKLKAVMRVLDDCPVFSDSLFELIQWSASYYHHGHGEAFSTALPVALRSGNECTDPTLSPHYRLTSNQPEPELSEQLTRSPKQKDLYLLLARECRERSVEWMDSKVVNQLVPQSRALAAKLEQKGLLEIMERPGSPSHNTSLHKKPLTLTEEQIAATQSIIDKLGEFCSFLLYGITGSGKTEVYLEAAAKAIGQGSQVLVLVPEISLTPQLVNRFRARLGPNVCAFHSHMSNEERYKTWWYAREGIASVVLGTRSGVFTPLKRPGLIIVDEEHDISYKQQDGFRYHARDLAIKRASIENIPIVLGSATPSMESVHNQQLGRHLGLTLKRRAGTAVLPVTDTIDLNTQPVAGGISRALLEQIRLGLERNEQSILYINRRGFAPLVQCGKCQWQAICSRCDSHLIYHQNTQKLRCHHCGSTKQNVPHCPKCESRLFYAGFGTQRIEETLSRTFPSARVSRIDRDEITTQNKLEEALSSIARQEVDIVIGTQLITKGHDFPNVTLVGVINSDHGLYSHDFRSTEYLFQQLVQVSGRSGRGTLPGKVLIQTAHPNNEYLQYIKSQDFWRYSHHCLKERREAQFPPFSHIALWRAESAKNGEALAFLQSVARAAEKVQNRDGLEWVTIMDVVHSPMEKLAGRYRAQLMLKSQKRKPLHMVLNGVLEVLEHTKQASRVRWSIDVDPMEMF